MYISRTDIFKNEFDRPFILVKVSENSTDDGDPYFAIKLANSESFLFIDPETGDFTEPISVPISDGRVRCSECGEVTDNDTTRVSGFSLTYSNTGIIPHTTEERSPLEVEESISTLCDLCVTRIKTRYKQAIEGSESKVVSNLI